MHHMITVSVRDLRYDFPRVEALLRQGEEIQITKRGRAIARLVPEQPAPRQLPDFLGRLREIYGDRVLEMTGADLLAEERDRL